MSEHSPQETETDYSLRVLSGRDWGRSLPPSVASTSPRRRRARSSASSASVWLRRGTRGRRRRLNTAAHFSGRTSPKTLIETGCQSTARSRWRWSSWR